MGRIVEEGLGMHMKEGNIFTIDHNGDIDDSAFIVWKAELEERLPSFWQSMQ